MVLLLRDGWEKMAGTELLITFFFLLLLVGWFYLCEFGKEIFQPLFLWFLSVFQI